MLTAETGAQLYNGIGLGNVATTEGVPMAKYNDFCLETQPFPDEINHPMFPTVGLRPGASYQTTTVSNLEAPAPSCPARTSR